MAAIPKFFANVSGKLQEVIAAIATSAGAGSSNQIPALDATGRLDISFMPVGIAPDTAAVTATENLSAGAFVNIYSTGGANFSCRNADCTTNGKPAHGFVLAAVSSGATAQIFFAGNDNTGVSGATAGLQFLGTIGGFTATPPSASGNLVQQLGVATSATSINFQPQTSFTLA